MVGDLEQRQPRATSSARSIVLSTSAASSARHRPGAISSTTPAALSRVIGSARPAADAGSGGQSTRYRPRPSSRAPRATAVAPEARARTRHARQRAVPRARVPPARRAAPPRPRRCGRRRRGSAIRRSSRRTPAQRRNGSTTLSPRRSAANAAPASTSHQPSASPSAIASPCADVEHDHPHAIGTRTERRDGDGERERERAEERAEQERRDPRAANLAGGAPRDRAAGGAASASSAARDRRERRDRGVVTGRAERRGHTGRHLRDASQRERQRLGGVEPGARRGPEPAGPARPRSRSR